MKHLKNLFCLVGILIFSFPALADEDSPKIRIEPNQLRFLNSSNSSLSSSSLSKTPALNHVPFFNQRDDGRYHAIAPSPQSFAITQPDGTVFQARRGGTAYHNWLETPQGQRLAKNPKTGYYEYLQSVAGTYIYTGQPAGRPFAGRVASALRSYSLVAPKVSVATITPRASVRSEQNLALSRGVVKQLVILANFSNTAPTYSQAEFHQLFNGSSPQGQGSSVRDYYRECSYGQLEVETTVAVWVTLPRTRDYYGANSGSVLDIRGREMIADAITVLDSRGFDFSPFDGNGDGWVDCFSVIHQGRGEEAGGGEGAIWSHKWSLQSPITVDGVKIQTYYTTPELYYSQITTIGVICHEMGHFFGLDDLYDMDGSSAGVGKWGLMASGTWNGSGKSPAHPCGWSKVKLGWIQPRALKGSLKDVKISQVETNPQVLIVPLACSEKEYFLIENRQRVGFDQSLPGDGLLIWHIDENQGDNSNETHYRVALEQADGRFNLESNWNFGDGGDTWPGTANGLVFNQYSVPNSKSYSGKCIDVSISNISPSEATMTFDLTGEPEGEAKKLSQTFTIYNDGKAPLRIDSLVKQSGTNWIGLSSFAPLEIAPGGSKSITVTIDTQGLAVGNYADRLLVYSNDPDHPIYLGGVFVSLTLKSLPANDSNAQTSSGGASSGGGGGCSLSSGSLTSEEKAGTFLPLVLLFGLLLLAKKKRLWAMLKDASRLRN